MADLILASQSYRRQQLLTALGIAFIIVAADVDEAALPGEQPDALVCRLSRWKAQAVAARYPGQVVLAADTIVILDDAVLGKPANSAEAVVMLRALRGRTHKVCTAVCLIKDGNIAVRSSLSYVTMRSYSDAEIAAYVATGDPLDKAGAYAIQHPLFSPVATWEGCYTSIMGLPLQLVKEMLDAVGVKVPGDVAGACSSLTGARCCAANTAV